MDDIESLCKRVLILNEGRIFLDGSLASFRQKISSERRLIVDLLHENDTLADFKEYVIKQERHRVWLNFDPALITTPEIISRITAKHSITDLYVENPPIEELIARFYREANL